MFVGPPSPSSSPSHDRRFWVSFSFLCVVLALAEAARGIVLSTLSLYVSSLGGSPSLLGVMVAAFSVGRLVSSMVYGVVADRFPLYVPLIGSVLLAIIGNILFIIPPYLGAGALYVLVFARLLTGFATGTLSLARAFTSRETSKAERTKFMSWLGIVQFAGSAFTPILGGIEVDWQLTGAWTVNTYVAGTYFLLILDVAVVGGLWWGMRCGRGENGEEVAQLSTIQLTVPMPALEDKPAGHAQSGNRRFVYSAIVESGDQAHLSAAVLTRHEAEQVEEGKHEAIHPQSTAPVETPPLISRASCQQMSEDEVKQPALPASPLHLNSLHRRSLSVATPTSRPAAISFTERRLSAPPTVDLGPIRREELSSMSIVSPTPSEVPTLFSASWRSSPMFTPIFFICLNATSRGCLAVAETYGSILFYTAVHGPAYNPAEVSTTSAAWFYTILGGVGVVVFILMDTFTHLVNEITLLLCGFIAMSLGFSLSLDFDHDLNIVELSFSMAMIYCLATPITQTLVASMLSKSLSKAEQGKWMGLLTAAGSVGRIVFPLLAGVMYSPQSNNLVLMLPALVAMIAVLAIGLGTRMWQQCWQRIENVADRAQDSLADWRKGWDDERRDAAEAAQDQDDDGNVEDDWLTIDQVMERMQCRSKEKRRRRRQQEPRAQAQKAGADEDEDERHGRHQRLL